MAKGQNGYDKPVYAQIKDGMVVNIIVLDHEDVEKDHPHYHHLFGKGAGHDHLKRIDHRKPVPHMGDLYDEATDTFSKPVGNQ